MRRRAENANELRSGLNFCSVEKNWPRQDSFDREQFGMETEARNFLFVCLFVRLISIRLLKSSQDTYTLYTYVHKLANLNRMM